MQYLNLNIPPVLRRDWLKFSHVAEKTFMVKRHERYFAGDRLDPPRGIYGPYRLDKLQGYLVRIER